MSEISSVTVVTVTLRGGAALAECLGSIAAQEPGPFELDAVVVDNGAPDGTAELVASALPGARVLHPPTNLGFAGGNNLVLDRLTSTYALLLNDDAIAEPGVVRLLVDAMDHAAPEVAAMSARVLLASRFRAATDGDVDVVEGPDGSWVQDPDGDVRLVNSTGNEVRRDGFGTDRGWLARSDEHHPGREVFGICGAAAIVRTSALREVGTFDPTFFMYYEDSDLSWRLRLAGYRVEYLEDAVVHHHHAATSDETSDFFRFHDSRNRLLTVAKNATWPTALRVVGRFVLTSCSITVRRSQPTAQIRTRWRAFGSFLRLLPSTLVRRRAQGPAARRSRRLVEQLLVAVPERATTGYRR